jgi:peptidoglycan/xylan/chitin deacetylase (PgdA/CDA1 family)
VKRWIKLCISLLYFPFVYFYRRTVVLYYHAVHDEEVAAFEQQIKMISRYAAIVSPYELFSFKKRLNILITVDDGFDNFLHNIVPVLNKNNASAIIFVPTGHIGKQAGWPLNQDNPEMIMSETQIQETANMRFEIGSHCVSHCPLSLLNSAEKKAEIFDSKQKLEKILKKPIRFLSFPHGVHDDTVDALCASAGYTKVFTIDHKYYKDREHPFSVGRVKVDTIDSPLEYYLKINGAYCWMPLFQRFFRQ